MYQYITQSPNFLHLYYMMQQSSSPLAQGLLKCQLKHSVIIILNDHYTTTLLLFQFKVCFCTLHNIIHYNDSHKNLVSNGDGAKISVFIKIMYKEFKTKHSTQNRLNIAVTPADIKLVKSKQQSSSDQLSLKYDTSK